MYSKVTCLRGRNQASHDAWAAELLHRAIVGSEPAAHPELAAFRRGFQLRCRNGFNFCEVRHCFKSLISGG